jgi:hypothetical protein
VVVGGAVVSVVEVVVDVVVVGAAVVSVVEVVVDVVLVVGAAVVSVVEVVVDVVLVVDVGPARAASARAIHSPTANSIDTIFSALLGAPLWFRERERTSRASVPRASLVTYI